MKVKKEYKLERNVIDAYFQKSYRFLYPLLKIRNRKIVPLQTFTKWKGEVTIKDKNLICVFELADEQNYKDFEKFSLFSNPMFHNFYTCEDNKGAYLFDMSPYSLLWENFHKGKYSKFSNNAKSIILEYCSLNKNVKEYMDSYLNPEKYFPKYAELLGIDEKDLKDVGELCNPPDLDRETFLLEKINNFYDSNL